MSVLAAATAVCKGPWVLARLELFFDLLWVKAHLFEEAVNHVLPSMCFSMVTMTVVTVSVVVIPRILLTFIVGVSVCLSVAGFCLFAENSYHNSRCSSCFLDLQERMIMVKFFFAICTVIKIFADSALVANSKDRRLTASIARNTNMTYDLLSSWFL